MLISVLFLKRTETAFQCNGVAAVGCTHHPVVKTCNDNLQQPYNLDIVEKLVPLFENKTVDTMTV